MKGELHYNEGSLYFEKDTVWQSLTDEMEVIKEMPKSLPQSMSLRAVAALLHKVSISSSTFLNFLCRFAEDCPWWSE